MDRNKGTPTLITQSREERLPPEDAARPFREPRRHCFILLTLFELAPPGRRLARGRCTSRAHR